MSSKEYVRTERGERVDQPDFQHAAETSSGNIVYACRAKDGPGRFSAGRSRASRRWTVEWSIGELQPAAAGARPHERAGARHLGGAAGRLRARRDERMQ